jgi:MFS family permease
MLNTKYKMAQDIRRAASSLGITRNVAVLGASIFGLGLGEELWQAYLPKYLAALGASGLVIGVFASTKDLLDGLYQYPGGWVTDRFGRRRALMLFTSLAIAGYAIYALARHWAILFIGVALVMAWKSGAFPATFAVIGDSLPPGRRAIAFSVQSILVRLPRVLGAPAGGLLIVALGLTAGLRTALAATIVIALAVLLTQRRHYREPAGSVAPYEPLPIRSVWRAMSPALRRLLLADCLVRIGEGIAAVFIILYVTDVLGFSAPTYGLLYAMQQGVAILSYLPAGRAADLTGRTPLVALTFCFFALFPLAVYAARSLPALALAFLVGGLKEVGEPARKSLIVDLAAPASRGRAVGLYYTIRNLLVVPAGTLGGLLWQRSPSLPLQVASAVGLCGVVLFLLTSKGASRHEVGHA